MGADGTFNLVQVDWFRLCQAYKNRLGLFGSGGQARIIKNSSQLIFLGIDIEESERKVFSETLLKDHSSLPVFIDQNTSNLHYNGFSNGYSYILFDGAISKI